MLYSRKVGALPGIIAAENVLRSRRDYDLASKAQQDAADYRRDYLSGLQDARQSALEDKQFERDFRQRNYDENRRIQQEQAALDKVRYDEDRRLRKEKYEQEGKIAAENLALAQMEKQRSQQEFDAINLARQRYNNFGLDKKELLHIGTKLSNPNIDFGALDLLVNQYLNDKKTYELDKRVHEVAMEVMKGMKFDSPEARMKEYIKTTTEVKNRLLGNTTNNEVLTGKDADIKNLEDKVKGMEKK